MSITLSGAPVEQLKPFHFTPKDVPITSEDIAVVDCYLEGLWLAHKGGASAVTVTVSDKQAPATIVASVTLAKGEVMPITGLRWCPGGLSWIASLAGVVGYGRIRK